MDPCKSLTHAQHTPHPGGATGCLHVLDAMSTTLTPSRTVCACGGACVWGCVQLGVRNFFENTATVQFDHRMLAYTTLASVATLMVAARRGGRWAELPRRAQKAITATTHMVGIQVRLILPRGVHHPPRGLSRAPPRLTNALLLPAAHQALLGISTLMMYVPVHLGVTHQVRTASCGVREGAVCRTRLTAPPCSRACLTCRVSEHRRAQWCCGHAAAATGARRTAWSVHRPHRRAIIPM